MRFTLIVLTALVASATVDSHKVDDFGEGPLHEDLQYFLDMIPIDEATEIVLQYAAEEPHLMEEILTYFSSDAFKQLVIDMEAIPEFREFVDYMENNGIYMYEGLNQLNEALNLEPFHPVAVSYRKIRGGGWGGLYQDLKELINYDDFIHGYVYKMKTSAAFRDYIRMLRSPGHQRYVNALYSNKGYLDLRAVLIGYGVDMKLIEDVITVVLGIEFPVPAMYASSQLTDDLTEFVKLAMTEEVINLLVTYVTQDEEVIKAFEYSQNPEFHQLVRNVEALKEYQDLVLYLDEAGLDIFTMINQVHQAFGMEDYVPPKRSYNGSFVKMTGGLKGMVEDVKALLPVKELQALYKKKMETSKAFADFIAYISSPEMQTIVNKVYSHEIFIEMRETALAAGLDLEAVSDLFHTILGINFPAPATYANSQLTEDLTEFAKLAMTEEVINLLVTYVTQDEEVIKAFEYSQNPEFHQLVRNVEALKEYQDLVLYLDEAGLDIFTMINQVHQAFGMEDYVPPKRSYNGSFVKMTGGLKGMVEDVKALLPVKELQALYKKKMETSKAFADFIAYISSPEMQTIVNKVYSHEIFIEMRETALAAGLDLEAVSDLFHTILGITFPAPATYANKQLSEDLAEFAQLAMTEEVINVLLTYITQDEEVIKAFEYTHNPEFHQLVLNVEALKEYQDLVFYLYDAGLDIFEMINYVHQAFGMDDYVPPVRPYNGMNKSFTKITGGLKGLVDDVQALLPVKELQALYKKKMETSKAFADFIAYISSPVMQTIVNKIYSHEIFIEMREKALEAGLDLKLFADLIYSILGIKFPQPGSYASGQLTEDLNEFVKLAITEEVINVVLTYITQDEEVIAAFEYTQNPEFHQLVRNVEALKEYQDFVLYLDDAGLDIFNMINQTHRAFGMEDYVPPKRPFNGKYMSFTKATRGLKGMVEAVKALLPIKELQALYKKKMETSEAFAKFIERISSPEMQTIVNKIYSHEIFQEMRETALAAGLDLDAINELIYTILGITFPKPAIH